MPGVEQRVPRLIKKILGLSIDKYLVTTRAHNWRPRMTTDTHITEMRRRVASRARRTGSIRPLAWIRHHPGAMTLPSQQAVDAISNTPDFPHH